MVTTVYFYLHLKLIGFFNHALNPINPLIAYISNIIIENAIADSLLNPKYENKIISVASLVPIPDIDIGIKVTTAEIDTQVAK